MSFERILETRDLLANLATPSSQLWNSTGTALDFWYEATKPLVGSMVFQEPTSPMEKQRNRQHVI
jgi:hypothetical protein